MRLKLLISRAVVLSALVMTIVIGQRSAAQTTVSSYSTSRPISLISKEHDASGEIITRSPSSTHSVFLPIVLKSSSLLVEEFETPSPYWEEYLNYWRLNEEQWHYKPHGSDDGAAALAHSYWLGVSDPADGAHDALIGYKGPDAEQWTDYVFTAKAALFADDGTARGLFGVWFRGTMDQEDQLPGRYVTGYYLVLAPRKPGSTAWRAALMQLRTDDDCQDSCNANYHFSNPMVLESRDADDLGALGLTIDWGRWYWLRVEVEGPRIRCYVDDVLVFDHYDDVGTTFLQGTVGFYTYVAGDVRFDHVTVMSVP